MTRQRLFSIFRILSSLLLVGGVIWLVYLGLQFVWTALSSVNPSLAVGIIAAGSTIFVSVVSVLISKRLEQKALIRNQQRDKKIPIYEELITFLFKIWRNAIDGTAQPTEKEMVDFMIGFTQKLLIWGSDEVVASFCKFRKSGQDPKTIMFAIEDIWLAVRRDLGHDNKGISRGMLLGLIVTDIDDYIKKT